MMDILDKTVILEGGRTGETTKIKVNTSTSTIFNNITTTSVTSSLPISRWRRLSNRGGRAGTDLAGTEEDLAGQEAMAG